MRKANEMIENRLKRAVENDVPNLLPQLLKHIEEEGEYNKMTNNTMPADEMNMPKIEKSSGPGFKGLKAIGVIAASLIVLIGGYSGYAHYSPQATINFDVNPSIEVSINRGDKILKVKPLNEEGRIVIGDMDLRKVDLEIATNALIGSMIKNGYIDDMKNSILITVESKNVDKELKLQERISKEIDTILEAYALNGAILSQTAKNDDATKKLSEEYGISLGKASLIERLVKEDPTIKHGDLAGLPINDIKLIMEAHKTKPQGIKSTGQASSKSYIGNEKALDIGLKAAGLSENSISKLEVELDYEDGRMIYEVEFYGANTKYEYEIDAASGEIIESKVKSSHKEQGSKVHADPNNAVSKDLSSNNVSAPPSNTGSKDTSSKNTASNDIGSKKALQIALQHLGVAENQVSKIEIELDHEDGRLIYEVEFKYNGLEYEYEIDSKTGKIIEISID